MKSVKMKPVDIKDNEYIDFSKEVNIKFPITKTFLLKDTLQTGLNKLL